MWRHSIVEFVHLDFPADNTYECIHLAVHLHLNRPTDIHMHGLAYIHFILFSHIHLDLRTHGFVNVHTHELVHAVHAHAYLRAFHHRHLSGWHTLNETCLAMTSSKKLLLSVLELLP
jgi:hypothetical protein